LYVAGCSQDIYRQAQAWSETEAKQTYTTVGTDEDWKQNTVYTLCGYIGCVLSIVFCGSDYMFISEWLSQVIYYYYYYYYYYVHLMAFFPGQSGQGGMRKVSHSGFYWHKR